MTDIIYSDREAKCLDQGCEPLTISERLQHKRDSLEKELAKVDRAQQALKDMPDVAKVLDLVKAAL